MSHSTQHAAERPGQIHAGTLFALTLALLGGLIGAWLFKTYVLNGRPTPAPVVAPASPYQLTVAAVNLTDKTIIRPGMVKTVNVSREEYERTVGNSQRVYLRGNQPIDRTTIKSVKAEMPIFEDEVEPLGYARPVSEDLAPGKRAVIIEVPSRQAMVQVGDHVDVLGTLSNATTPSFGLGRNVTAVIAKDLPVKARFNTTRTGVLPAPGDTTRTYTLEASPYRHELIELARSFGVVFTLSVSPRTKAGSGVARDMMPDEDPQVDHVTAADLAKVFGITASSLPPEPKRVEVERFSGVNRQGTIVFESNLPINNPVKPAVTSRVSALPSGSDSFAAPAAQATPSTGFVSNPVAGQASAENNFGFEPPSSPNNPKACATCGKKKN